jgi:superfamily II DNA or RNA helicase/HKD family nuclease/diadenosine tetraphosphate (Ap4A) HIT family hydrolase
MPEPSLEADCPFCLWSDADCLLVSPLLRAHLDAFPVNVGHALIVTRRHVADWWSATDAERHALAEATADVRQRVEAHLTERGHPLPTGWNLGVNAGRDAGQTVPHLHLHLIPRYPNDVPDPTGGVRGVIPGKANYRAGARPLPADTAPHARPLVTGGSNDPLLPHLRAHLAAAARVDIAVAFVSAAGVLLLLEHLRDVTARGGTVRILTGDYLDVTEPEALRRLLDLGDRVELRVIETGGASFHVKSYVCIAHDIESDAQHAAGGQRAATVALVGSSNLTRTALLDGLEWNYRAVGSHDEVGLQAVLTGFGQLWADPRAVPVTPAWIHAYEQRRAVRRPLRTDEATIIEDDAVHEPAPPVPEPHAIQREALAALDMTRTAGNRAGLVVLATGLGKTWLAAYDTVQASAKRVLFVAHREEILDQALATFRAIRPAANLGKYAGSERAADAEVVFASIQTLGRTSHLQRFARDHFDYVIVDEFHHASAATYRRLLDHFMPRFLLGLTATPARSDGADLLTLCGDNLVYTCGIPEGIRLGLLSPFDYYGVPDDVDYQQIPWRSARFDERELTAAVATERRASNALEQLATRGGTKTIAFCVSQRHADFMAAFSRERGLRAAAIHAGPASDPRTLSLERLRDGSLDIVFAVDMFNEGVDVPEIDTVLMLRPTESSVLWLQQLGRGLRYREGKRLAVIDYIGNHRSFLLKPRALFDLAEGDAYIERVLKLAATGQLAELLPPGCSVTYDLEAIDILQRLLRPSRNALDAFYDDFLERHGVRPTAVEADGALVDPASVRANHGSWFEFVRSRGHLDDAQAEAEQVLRPFLKQLEVTPMTKSYKMVVLLALLAEDGMPGSAAIDALVRRVGQVAERTPGVRQELASVLADATTLADLLERYPIARWVAGGGTGGTRYFRYDDRMFSAAFELPAHLKSAATELVREIAEWRLAKYLRRAAVDASVSSHPAGTSFTCKVSHANGRPILFLPDRDLVRGIPSGWTTVRAVDEEYEANFVKIAVNVMRRPGSARNVLSDVLRGWFGDQAGQPGTMHQVEFRRDADRWVLKPHLSV